MAIKIGNNDITFKVGSTDVDAIYLGNTLVYSGGTPPTGQTPQFAVVQDIQSYTATTFNKVYTTSDNKWYMLNNLNQYEEYGIYDVSGSSLSDYTYYEGKLVAIGTTEYQYSGGSWVTVGTYEDTEATYTIDDTYPSPYVGETLSTTFKIPVADVETIGLLDLRIRTSDEGNLNIGTDEYAYFGSDYEEGTVTFDADYYYYSLPTTQSVVINSIDYWESTPIHLIVGSKQISVEYTDIDKPYGAVSFSSMTDASNYADVYYGLAAHIDNNDYVYTTANTWSQVTQTQANYFRVKTSSVGLDFTNKASSGSLYVSYNWGNNWYETNSLLAVDSGNTVMFKGDLIPSSDGIGQFSNNILEVEGNIMSLMYGDNFIGQTDLSGKNNAFVYLFSGCTTLTSAENLSLPATTLAQGCYNSMFNGCTSLTTAPILSATTLATACYSQMFWDCTSLTTAPELLPATTLSQSCYNSMFNGCTSLTTAPQLPATTLANSCYNFMFADCTSLTTAPQLPATTLANSCYNFMFRGCTSLTTAPSLPATTLANNCYYHMFYGCTSLTTAPVLSATTLTSYCYYSMFDGCSNLSSITCLATSISASNCTTNWVRGVSSSGTFTKAASMTSWTTNYNGIPSGWTVQDYAG